MLGHSIKTLLAKALSASGISDVSIAVQRRARSSRFMRAINYHGTSPVEATNMDAQLAFLARHFTGVGLAELESFLATGRWPHAKPGMLITFDDALRTNFDVAVPLLEKHGFIGWFFAPVAFVDCPAADQVAFARQNGVGTAIGSGFDYPDGRIAMSWDELRQVATRHVVGCHTMNHRRMPASVPPAEMRHEIIDAKRLIEARMGREVPTFCWVGGEEQNYSAEAAAIIREAGFRFGFMTNSGITTPRTNPLQIQRTNVEAHWPLAVVKFQLCGAMDLLHAGKRARVNRLTAAT